MTFLNIWDKLYHMEQQRVTEEKVFSYMQEHHMLQDHDKVIVGVSGGADSVCLLFVLLEYAKIGNLQLAVVHVNHGIRPEAGEDADYVEALCKEHKLPFYLTNTDVRKEALMQGCSEEEVGRNIRYRAFAEAAVDFGADKIAVAHNRNDCAETMLFHLFRGSDLKGLGSIRPVRGNIIRPILCLERTEIEEYLKQRSISYCQDATNAGDDYTRNRIRHHILPYVEDVIAKGSISHMARTAEVLSETEEYLEQQTFSAMNTCIKELCTGACICKYGNIQRTSDGGAPDALTLKVGTLCAFHSLLQKRMIYFIISALADSRKDISNTHVTDVLQLCQKEGNRQVCLPYGIVAERSYDQVIVQKKQKASTDKSEVRIWEPVYRAGDCRKILGCSAEEYLRRLCDFKGKEVGQNEYTKCFDYDKIEQSALVLRTRRTGDYLTLAGKDGAIIHKSLKDYMINEKIPRGERDHIPLLAVGNHVLWLVGYRISEYYKINANTKQVLQVQLKRKNCQGSETEDKNG